MSDYNTSRCKNLFTQYVTLIVPWMLLRSTVPDTNICYSIIVYFSNPITIPWFPSEVWISFLIKASSYLHKFKGMNFILPLTPSALHRNPNKILFSFWKQNWKNIILLTCLMPAGTQAISLLLLNIRLFHMHWSTGGPEWLMYICKKN